MSLYFPAWFCWIIPFVGAPLIFLAEKINNKLRDGLAVSLPFLSMLMCLMLLPNLLTQNYFEEEFVWVSIPNLKPITIGVLVDPLSIIIANVVAFISFLIMVYSIKYMHDEEGVARYWFMMNLFIGGMLLLVLANNFIFFLAGWKTVGLCSYALIGHYYRDEPKDWIGGPPPTPYQTPSQCGLKAWIMTSVGDIFLLAGLILLYLYSGTVNFTELFQTQNLWMPTLTATPGMFTLISILLLCGPLGKSAQFPLHEWLPEAMAGPAPVSALIHAATMVKAGVYMVARFLPVFFYGYWVGGFNEALTFFILAAYIGGFTAFLTGTQAMVSLELKKALAYSTMSQIGYMMLGLGIAGLNPKALILGYVAGIFHLISHALFKASLFLCSGTVIHECKSIYMADMGGIKKEMPITWFLMWISALSLAGFPFLSGFWSKDAVLVSCLTAQNYWLFMLALGTAALTSFYSIRFMGLTFHGDKSNHLAKLEKEGEKPKETSPLMWIPYGILTAITILVGVTGPFFESFIHHIFESFLHETLHLPINGFNSEPTTHLLVPLASIGVFLLGGIPAYLLYIKRQISPEKILTSYSFLSKIKTFLWNRWYIDPLYNLVFVKTILKLRPYVERFIEHPMDVAYNVGVPKLMSYLYFKIRKFQTGILPYNMLYILLFIIATIISLLVVWS